VILVAGLTPAWQQILRFDDFRPGEVNRASEVQWCCSGKVLNPIGSGDCLMTGLDWGLSQGQEPREAICLGMAAAAENATRLLPADIDFERVRRRRKSLRYAAV